MLTHHQNMNFQRPTEVNGKRIYYNQTPKFNPKTYTVFDPDNVLTQIKLYRYFRSRAVSDPVIITKDQFMEDVFSSHPQITKLRVGKIFKMIMPYKIHFQRNPSKQTGGVAQTLYKWRHPKELQYGLEFLILTWLPYFIEEVSDDVINTAKLFIEELDILYDQTPKEDSTLVNEIIERKMQLVSFS